MNVGDKVVCVDATPNPIVHHISTYPDGFLREGTVYVVRAVRSLDDGPGVQVIGCRTYMGSTENWWRAERFRKLDALKQNNALKAGFK